MAESRPITPAEAQSYIASWQESLNLALLNASSDPEQVRMIQSAVESDYKGHAWRTLAAIALTEPADESIDAIQTYRFIYRQDKGEDTDEMLCVTSWDSLVEICREARVYTDFGAAQKRKLS